MKTFNDFIDLCCEQISWPEAEVRRCVALHMEAGGISEQDVALYINYPAHTEHELAKIFGLTRRAVQCALSRVRRVYPSLRNDATPTQHGAAQTPKMVSYEPWMDEIVTDKF